MTRAYSHNTRFVCSYVQFALTEDAARAQQQFTGTSFQVRSGRGDVYTITDIDLIKEVPQSKSNHGHFHRVNATKSR